jgi:hypothetical protein
MSTCNITEQYSMLKLPVLYLDRTEIDHLCLVATTITQDYLCAGVPQPSRSEETRRASIIIVVITVTVIILRFISRVFVAHKVWWDDWLILATTVSQVLDQTTNSIV